MTALVECVPNFSEGRRPEVIHAIVAAIESVPEARILDREMDADHNRAVITFVAPPDAVGEAAFRAAEVAAEHIDLSSHAGEHPRMGATDVCPFVPIRDVSMPDCIAIAEEVGRRIGEDLRIPVFLYEEAARRPERRNLAVVRKGQFEGLRDAIGADPDRTPDFGPNHIHPTAGATAVGARMPLIAYNVNLRSTNLKAAKQIAKKIRESSGGLPCVKALGMDVPAKGCVQVSMNLTNFHVSNMDRVYLAIEEEAKTRDIEILESEIVGLVPAEAMQRLRPEVLRLTDFNDRQVIENLIAS